MRSAILVFLLSVSASAQSLVSGGSGGATQASVSESTVTIAGTGSRCFSADNPTLVVDCGAHTVTVGGAGLTVTYGVAAATGVFSGLVTSAASGNAFSSLTGGVAAGYFNANQIANAPGNGFYAYAGNSLGLTSNGVRRFSLDGNGVTMFGNNGAVVSSFTALGSLNLANAANITIASPAGTNLVAFSSVPIHNVSGAVIVGTLATGTTFMAFTPDAAITLTRVSCVVEVAGIGGAGDVIKCNNSTGTGVSVTLSAAAAAGTYTTAPGSAAIAYQNVVSCHIDSAATTRPITTCVLEYTMQ